MGLGRIFKLGTVLFCLGYELLWGVGNNNEVLPGGIDVGDVQRLIWGFIYRSGVAMAYCSSRTRNFGIFAYLGGYISSVVEGWGWGRMIGVAVEASNGLIIIGAMGCFIWIGGDGK